MGLSPILTPVFRSEVTLFWGLVELLGRAFVFTARLSTFPGSFDKLILQPFDMVPGPVFKAWTMFSKVVGKV